MALSFEDFKALRAKGLTDDQIDRFEQGVIPKKKESNARSFISGTIHNVEKALSVASDPTARGLAGALELVTSGNTRERLKGVRKTKDIAYGSDVIDQLQIDDTGMGIFDAIPGASLGLNLGRAASRTLVDTVTDPLSYIGFGLPTKFGRLATSVKEAIAAGQTIKLDSKLARGIAQYYGETKTSPKLINQFKKEVKNLKDTKTFSQQVSTKQRSLASIGPIPLGTGETAIPGLTGELAGKLVKPFSMARRGATGVKIERLFRETFSTKSGDPDFDLLASKFRSQVEAYKGAVIEDAKILRNERDDLTRALGISKEELNKQIRNIGEAVAPLSTTTVMKKVKGTIPLYHGTYSTDFKREVIKPSLFNGSYGPGIYTSTNPGHAASYAEQPAKLRTDVLLGAEVPMGGVVHRFDIEPRNLVTENSKVSTDLIKNGVKFLKEVDNKEFVLDLIKNKKFISGRVFGSLLGDIGIDEKAVDLFKFVEASEVKALKIGEETVVYDKSVLTSPRLTKSVKTKINKQKYGKAIFDELEHYYTDKLVGAQVALKNAHKVGNQQLIEQSAKQVAEYNGQINLLTGQYKPPASIDPAVDKLVDDFRERYAQQILREQTSGVNVRPILSDRSYIPHALTSDVRKALSQKLISEGKLPSKMSMKEFDDSLSNAIRREFVEVNNLTIDAWADVGIITKRQAKAIRGKGGRGNVDKLDELLESGKITEDQYTDAVHTLSIDEVNALPKDVKMKIFGTDADEIFYTDPIYYTTVRGIRGEVARSSAEFFTEMRKRGLAVTDDVAPADWVNVKQVELKGHKVSPDVARSLNKWNDFNNSPTEIRKVLQMYDRFHNWQKLWTLAPFPAYHILNAVGNFWNNFLAGVTNPDVYHQAIAVQRDLYPKWFQKILGGTGANRSVTFKDTFGTVWDKKRLVEEAKLNEVIGKGQFGGDIQRTLDQELSKGKLFTLSSRQHLLRAGNRLGKLVEDNARMAHFIDRLRKGDTAEQAAMSVKKYLFDYSDLSDIERNVLNRTFFFYTWTRKNIPLQLHSLVTTPAKFSLLYKTKHEIEKETAQPDERYLQEYVKENFPIRIRYDAKNQTHEYFMLNRWLPAADLLKLSHLHEIAAQSLAPIPKEALQQLWNYDYFTKKKIDELEPTILGRVAGKGSKTRFLGKDIPTSYVHGAKIVRLLNEIDKMTKEDTDMYSKMIGLMTGKNYQYDPKGARLGNKGRVDDDLDNLYENLYREQGKKQVNKQEVRKIMELIKIKSREY